MATFFVKERFDLENTGLDGWYTSDPYAARRESFSRWAIRVGSVELPLDYRGNKVEFASDLKVGSLPESFGIGDAVFACEEQAVYVAEVLHPGGGGGRDWDEGHSAEDEGFWQRYH